MVRLRIVRYRNFVTSFTDGNMSLHLQKVRKDKPNKIVGKIRLRIAVEDTGNVTEPVALEMTDAVTGAKSALSEMVVGPKAVDSEQHASDKVQSAIEFGQSASASLSDIGPWNNLIQRIKDFDTSAIVKAVDAVAEVSTPLSDELSTT
jgi:hypothetical protein